MADNFSYLEIISVAFACAFILTSRVKAYLLSKSLLDHPNGRSSHTVPVPRGGGWALILIFVPALIIATYTEHFTRAGLGLTSATLLLAFISWQDDRVGVSAAKRLLLHIASAGLGSLAFTSDQTIFAGVTPFWLDRFVMIIGWAWFMNLYNFMDGIDGITGSETIALAAGSCLVISATGAAVSYAGILIPALIGSCLGFLAYNWHPAKIFLGDIGSVPLGFLTGYILLSLAVRGYIASALILSLYYVADSGITLVKRAMRGEKIWQPHRQHFYQQAARRMGRHDKVVYGIIFANLGLIVLALLAITRPWTALALAIVVVAILLRWMHKS